VTASNLAELPGWAAHLVCGARVAHLGLLDDHDRPRVQPVTFAPLAGVLWSAIDEKPKRIRGERLARVRFLRRNPHAALTVDRYSEDWTRLAWVQILGSVEVVDRADAPGAMAALIAKYEPYRESPPSGPLLALAPQRCLCWRAAGRAGRQTQSRNQPSGSGSAPAEPPADG
jgi:PPOX class probable F420-dependent enzyme